MADMAAIIQAVKAFREGLTASGTQIPLMTIGHLAVFVSFGVTTQGTLHKLALR
jgi:hypothetical protein